MEIFRDKSGWSPDSVFFYFVFLRLPSQVVPEIYVLPEARWMDISGVLDGTPSLRFKGQTSESEDGESPATFDPNLIIPDVHHPCQRTINSGSCACLSIRVHAIVL